MSLSPGMKCASFDGDADRIIYFFQGKGKDPSLRYKIADSSKFKAYADNKRIVTEKLKVMLENVENIVGKGVNAGNQHLLLIPQCFHKVSFS